MHVAFICDNNYAHATAISIRSVLKCSTPTAIWVVDAGLSPAQSAFLGGLAGCVNIVRIAPAIQSWLKSFRMHGDPHVTPATYAKLQLHHLLPTIDKVLYLDGDTIALKDLNNLFLEELGASYIGATFNVSQMHSGQARLNLPDLYFNAGVLLCPLRIWRTASVENDFLIWYRKHQHAVKFDDQDILNGVFSGRVNWINKRWNVSHWEIFCCQKEVDFDESECGIVHFNGKLKPWDPDYAQRWGLTPEHLRSVARIIAPLVHVGNSVAT